MIKIIINADDLGLSSKVNKAIGDALRKEVITSSTILANSNTWEEIHDIV
ncbi:MAG: ChbG/HpnK family deacetylase, partial [Bacteroidaceae bacterium]|nr:ChbG/HpnK family deacetylase [Bacteroidaceae bacterium]